MCHDRALVVSEGGQPVPTSSERSSTSAPLGPPGRNELSGAAMSGVAWKGMSQVISQATRFLLAIVLTHLLTPTEYGVAGMVLVFATFVIPFADLGLGPAVVQRRTLAAEDITTLFWTSIVAGLFFTSLGIGVASLVSRFYGVAEVAPLFAALSTSFIITALGATHRSLLVRELRFRSLELRVVAGLAVGAPAAVVVAAMGGGAWALITLELCAAVTSTILLWAFVPWRPTLSYSFASLRDLGGFGLKVLGARLFSDLAQIGDKVMIGGFVGAGALGVYSLSYSLVLGPMTRIVGPMQEVLFPTMSRIQDERQRLATIWLRANRALAALVFPAMFGIIFVAPEFVTVALGARWEGATPIVQVLAWAGLLQALQGLNAVALQARDRAGLVLRFTVAATVGSLVAFAAGLPWGALGVAVAYAIATTFLTPAFMWITARELGVSFSALFGSVAGVATATIGMVITLFAARSMSWFASEPPSVGLATLVIAGAIVYLLLLKFWCPQAVEDIQEFTVRRFRPSR